MAVQRASGDNREHVALTGLFESLASGLESKRRTPQPRRSPRLGVARTVHATSEGPSRLDLFQWRAPGADSSIAGRLQIDHEGATP
jgi:hypothetical protein